MTLFTDGITTIRFEPGRIDDIASLAGSKVFARIAVTSITVNGGRFKGRVEIAVQRSLAGPYAAGMTEQAIGSDGSIEVRLSILLVSGREVPCAPGGIPRNR
jgi:hypothetical protein